MKITILGGGPAGLSAGFYAKKHNISFIIFEAENHLGGSAKTIRHGDFLFDSGAHRFHDRDKEVTGDVRALLDGELKKIEAQSQIYSEGKFLDFPLSFLNLLMNLGVPSVLKAAYDLLNSRFNGKRGRNKNFENYALYKYGKTIAYKFLFPYSEKLWGERCSQLSLEVVGNRLKGLDIKTLFTEFFFSKKVKTEHLDGTFLYPTLGGIGSISDKLAIFCGEDNIQRNAKIIKIVHDSEMIQAIEVNGNQTVETEEVLSTLPISQFIQMMEPAPPVDVLLISEDLRYRYLILVAILLDRDSVSPNASVYFPDSDIPFTRIYEPKNRNPLMAPSGKTSLVAEIPCQFGDIVWTEKESRLVQRVTSYLVKENFIDEKDILGTSVHRIRYAYPVLDVDSVKKIEQIKGYLNGFSNLNLLGRSGQFKYLHIHDLFKSAKGVISSYSTKLSHGKIEG